MITCARNFILTENFLASEYSIDQAILDEENKIICVNFETNLSFLTFDINKAIFYNKNKIVGISETNLKYLYLINDLCKEKNIELILFNTPVHSYYASRIPDYFLSKYSEIVINKNLNLLDMHSIPFNDSCYIPDGDHLSAKGSVIFSKQLIK
jgi:hypothetical protein